MHVLYFNTIGHLNGSLAMPNSEMCVNCSINPPIFLYFWVFVSCMPNAASNLVHAIANCVLCYVFHTLISTCRTCRANHNNNIVKSSKINKHLRNISTFSCMDIELFYFRSIYSFVFNLKVPGCVIGPCSERIKMTVVVHLFRKISSYLRY